MAIINSLQKKVKTIQLKKMTLILDWLKNKLINGENGIIFDNPNVRSFDIIHDFLERYDRIFKTPVIYYQAFPEESAIEFLDTLREELVSKLGGREPNPPKSLSTIIQDAELQMVIIDNCHLHPQNTLQNLIDFFAVCNVALVLIGDQNKMAIAQILDNPKVHNWNRLEIVEQKCISVSKITPNIISSLQKSNKS